MDYDNDKIYAMFEGLMRDEILESPSLEFTEKVMEKVYALEASSATDYKPLISKRAWMAIVFVFVSLVVYVMLNGNTSESQWLANLKIPKFELNVMDKLNIQLSKTFSYAVIFLAVMIGVQVTVLKSYFDRRLSV
jgi:hypothetical protein